MRKIVDLQLQDLHKRMDEGKHLKLRSPPLPRTSSSILLSFQRISYTISFPSMSI